MVLLTCHEAPFDASWLVWLLILAATPSMTASNEQEENVDKSVSRARWQTETRGRRHSFIRHYFLSDQSLIEEVLHFWQCLHFLPARVFISASCELNSDTEAVSLGRFCQFSPCQNWNRRHQCRFVVTLQTSLTAASLLTERKAELSDKSEMIRVCSRGDFCRLEKGGDDELLLSQRCALQKPLRVTLEVLQVHITMKSIYLVAAKFKHCWSKCTT